MKILSLIFDRIKIFFRYLSKILPLFIGIAALYVANESMSNANKQFQINSETSDSLFNVQLKHSKELNDSLINQISILQDITNSQLQITDQQLNISKEILKDQIFSGRPKIYVRKNEIADTIKISDHIFMPKIETSYKNTGKRSANDLSIRGFILYGDLSIIKANLAQLESSHLEPEGERTFHLISEIQNEYKDNFYYCYDIVYYDHILEQKFIQSYYFRYYKFGDKYSFYECKNNEKDRIKMAINVKLRIMNERLFDQ